MNNLSGKILGNRYVLLEKVGEGGMALVYKARCQLLNRYVAIKILRQEFTTDEEFVRKFKRESMASASLSHPNIVGIYDVGEEDGIYYIVMEYIHGQTLKEYIKEKEKIEPMEAINIAKQISYGLEHAHKNGVVHRDIKPHNIMITDDKIIKVADFGIARASSTMTMTNTGKVMGSVHYFSPEQARGGYSDHRTDIYSLGVVMYEMIAGRLPYDAESPITVALKHIQETVIEPIEVDHNIPNALNDIVIKAMQKDMSKRYQNIRDLIGDLELAQNSPNTMLYNWETEKEKTRVISVEDIDGELEKKRKVKKRARTVKITFGTLSLLMLLVIGGVFAFNKWMVVQEVKIPPILGMQEVDARNLLEKAGLRMDSKTVSSEKPAGEVVKIYPEEGTYVKLDYPVTVFVSPGPEQVEVPDIKNINVVDAETLLRKQGLELGSTDTKYSDKVEKDLIIEQLPTAGSMVKKDSKVNIIISNGPELTYTTVPYLIGKTLTEAQNELLSSKLSLGSINYGTDSTYIDEVVISQSVLASTQLKEGSIVNITLNKSETNQTEPEGQSE
ncbi:MAG: pknB [Clostridiales bacterium]|jgi:serine/threonine-protein kinase|nr:pknB [Clostridiales bacterium]